MDVDFNDLMGYEHDLARSRFKMNYFVYDNFL